MTGADLKRIRQALGLSLSEMGRELGYKGDIKSLKADIWRFEKGLRTIPFERAYRANQLKEQRQC